ncbi:hypothetical protein NITHO_370012 [Nitrolancea hollandica Lb]|uniref:Uncharacterized protein n=1 Tax=Nitrolancea hollandica Lb TaxID=1129897 RepID=I4EIX8_9BACT|nr:hypothetical protein NITHO_370012 [Nitrolancea hollandica Lb]
MWRQGWVGDSAPLVYYQDAGHLPRGHRISAPGERTHFSSLGPVPGRWHSACINRLRVAVLA